MRRALLVSFITISLSACVSGSGDGGGYVGTAAGVDGGSTDGATGGNDTTASGADSASSGGASSGGTSSGGTSSGGTSSGGTSSGGTSSGGTSSGGTSSGGTSSGGTSSGGTSSGGTSSGGTSSGGTSSGGTSPGGTSTGPMVNKQCLDGKYTETLPNKDAPISQIISAYKPAAYKQFIKDVLAARYPFGKTLVEGALKSAPQDCVDTFLPASMRGSASQVMSRLGTIVHECGHFYDIYGAGGLTSKQWVIKDGLTFKCKGARATDSKRSSFGSNPSFSRNKINKDKWSAKHPPCTSFGGGSKNCDSYAYIYLNGDPDNGKFESGDQGFDNLIEEVTQYVNSLATGYAYQDQKGGFSKSSDRDGILNFLWYTERYLHMARTKYPDFYKFAANDKCWRELVLTLWGRAWLYLEATKNNSNLGINDAKLMGLVKDPELLAEIELFRKAQGCK